MTNAVKPLLRGHFHQEGFFIALGACAMLIPGSKEGFVLPNIIYSLGLLAMFGLSALYHRPTWSPVRRTFMGRLDHSGIYLMIAGSFTSLGQVLSHESERTILWIIWPVAIVGILQCLFLKVVPKWLSAIMYVGAGWLILPFAGELYKALTETQFALIIAGGLFYTIGAVFYALKWPVLNPRYFSYHEVFHLLVVVAAVAHFIVIYQISQKG